jgi:hypothetical protein
LNDNYDFLWICSVIRSLFLFLNELWLFLIYC